MAKIFRKASSLLLPSPAPLAKVISNTIVSDGQAASAVVISAFRAPVVHPDIAGEADPARRFEIAMHLAGKSEADLPGIERTAGNRFESYVGLFVVSILWMLIAPVLGLGSAKSMGIFGHIFPVCLVVLMGSLAFSSAVSLYRIQRRSMLSVRTFLADRAAWGGGRPGRGGLTLFLLTFAILSTFAPWPAMAAEGGSQGGFTAFLTSAGSEDLSIEWLKRLFPDMAGGSQTGNGDLLGAMFMVFNSALLGVGCMVLAWHTLSGTVATAHEGKLLGERWHTLWAPVRIVGGFGLLVPIKGYCGAQFIVFMLLTGGYNLANGVWAAYVDKAFTGEMSVAASGSSFASAGLGTANGILASETCVATLDLFKRQLATGDRFWNSNGRLSAAVARDYSTPTSGVAAPGSDGQRGAKVWDYGSVCGNVRTSPTAQLPAASDAYGAPGIGQSALDGANGAYSAFASDRDAAVQTLISAVRQSGLPALLADQTSPTTSSVRAAGQTGTGSVTDKISTAYEAVRTAATAFDASVDASAKKMSITINGAGADGFKARAKALGWASAGALNGTLMRAAARSQELVGAAAPRISGPDPTALNRLGHSGNSELQDRLTASMGQLKGIVIDYDQAGSAAPGAISLGADTQAAGWAARALRPLSDTLVRSLSDGAGRIDPVRPMSSIQATGNTMLTGAWSALIVSAGLSGAAEVGATQFLASTVGGGYLKGVGSFLKEAIYMLIVPLFIGGVLHAYILPMLPFIMWSYAILSCVSLAAELIVAAPVAAFMHMRADGQELINQEQRGFYVLAVNAVLRPSLLLLGLVIANLTFAIMGNFLNKTYGVAVTATNGDSLVGITGFVALTVLVFYLHYQMVVRSMQLISAVPAIVGHILGSPDLDRGEHSSTTNVLTAVTTLTTGGVRAGGGLMQPVLNKGRV